jgi:uncharacterized protein YjbJ (UPF0337 family)
MVSEQVFKGHWTEIRGRVKEKWGQLTDDDLVMAEGNLEQLAGIIQRRTGESREKIEHQLEGMTNEFGSKMENVRKQASAAATAVGEGARQYAGQAADLARGQYDQLHERYDHASAEMRARYSDAQDLVRRSPMESLMVAFGAGLMAGVVLGLSLRPRD